jgi:putative membrane protein
MKTMNSPKMNYRIWRFVAAIALFGMLTAQTSCKKDDDEEVNASLPAVDRKFVDAAAQSNLSEIEQGNLALQKATDADVKSFAQMMVDMHTQAQTELKQLGTSQSFTVADQLDEEHQSIKDQLAAKSGDAFDKAYINGQVTGHQKTSAVMQTEIDNGMKMEIKAYATKSKPMVDTHLASAMQIKTEKQY